MVKPPNSAKSEVGDPRGSGSIVIFGGDIVIFRSWLIRDLTAAGWKVIACGPRDDYQAQAVSHMGADYVTAPVDRTGLSPARDLMAVNALARTLRSLRPDVFLSFHTKYNVIGPIAARLARVPRIFALVAGLGYAFSPGSGMKRTMLRRVLSSSLSLSLRCCTGVFVQNEDDLALVARWVRKTTRVVKLNGTGVDVDEFSYTTPEVDSLRVLLVARLLEEKGIIDYVSAAGIVKSTYPDSTFSIIGPFDSNPGAISPEEVRGWEKDGVITYLGTSRDVRPHLRDCNLVVLPSYYREGLPKSLLEALAIGRAIVTCNTPGCRETVIDGLNGFLVPPRDPVALAAAIARFGEDHRLLVSMGLAGRRFAEEQFNVCDVNAVMMREMRISPAVDRHR